MEFHGVSINRGIREVVALAFVLTILTIEIWAFTDPAVTDTRPAFMLFIDLSFGIFTISAGYVVFGKQVLESAIGTWQELRSD